MASAMDFIEGMSKEKALGIAEVIDALRLFPRLYMLVYIGMLLSGHVDYVTAEDPADSKLSYLQVLWLGAGGITAFYFKSGRKWPGSV